jgi:hypothetical protein
MTRAACAALVTLLLSPAFGIQAQGVPADFLVKLERTRCFGTCPAYAVSIDAAGNVIYQGGDFVRVKGRRTARITPLQVAALAAAAERIQFFTLKDRYDAPITDFPTTHVTVTSNGITKSIADYFGAPDALEEFEELIDRTAGTARWIRIDVATLNQLFRDGPRPTAPALREMMEDALSANDVDVVEALLKRGVNAKTLRDGVPSLMFARSAAAIRILLKAGADPDAADSSGQTPLNAAANYPVEIAAALVDGGARVDGGEASRATPLYAASCTGNIGVVRLLLARGAKASAAYAGQSPLDCARAALKDRASYRLPWKLPYDEDYAAVIALLEAAVARAKPGICHNAVAVDGYKEARVRL